MIKITQNRIGNIKRNITRKTKKGKGFIMKRIKKTGKIIKRNMMNLTKKEKKNIINSRHTTRSIMKTAWKECFE